MLFNPKWQKAKNNCDTTLRGFRDWVEAQNPKARYCYPYKHNCAIGRWLKATDNRSLLSAHWGLYPVLHYADYIASQSPHTFGALAERLRNFADRPDVARLVGESSE